jgi:hypothetical protein
VLNTLHDDSLDLIEINEKQIQDQYQSTSPQMLCAANEKHTPLPTYTLPNLLNSIGAESK